MQAVDIRWPNEWDVGRNEGLLHIPPDELDDRPVSWIRLGRW